MKFYEAQDYQDKVNEIFKDFESSLVTIKNLGYVEKEGTLSTPQLCMLITEKYNHDVAIQLVENGSEFEDFLKFKKILSAKPSLVEEYNELKRSSSHLNEDEYRSKKSKWVESLLKSLIME